TASRSPEPVIGRRFRKAVCPAPFLFRMTHPQRPCAAQGHELQLSFSKLQQLLNLRATHHEGEAGPVRLQLGGESRRPTSSHESTEQFCQPSFWFYLSVAFPATRGLSPAGWSPRRSGRPVHPFRPSDVSRLPAGGLPGASCPRSL